MLFIERKYNININLLSHGSSGALVNKANDNMDLIHIEKGVIVTGICSVLYSLTLTCYNKHHAVKVPYQISLRASNFF